MYRGYLSLLAVISVLCAVVNVAVEAKPALVTWTLCNPGASTCPPNMETMNYAYSFNLPAGICFPFTNTPDNSGSTQVKGCNSTYAEYIQWLGSDDCTGQGSDLTFPLNTCVPQSGGYWYYATCVF